MVNRTVAVQVQAAVGREPEVYRQSGRIDGGDKGVDECARGAVVANNAGICRHIKVAVRTETRLCDCGGTDRDALADEDALIDKRLCVIAGDGSTKDIRRWEPLLAGVQGSVRPKGHPTDPARADVVENVPGQRRALEQLTRNGIVLFKESGFARVRVSRARV